MPASSLKKLKHFLKMKECMSLEQKKKLLEVLKSLREEYTGNVGGETDIANPDNLVGEDAMLNQTERNVVAKTFDTKADFDSYVNQRRGIEMTPKEQQAIIGHKQAKPTQQDKFFVKYETTDNFGNNDTTIIKKLKDGEQFCWTAFSKHETAEEEGQPEGTPGTGVGEEETSEEPVMKEAAPAPAAPPTQPAAATPSNVPSEPEDTEITIDDPIRITKTITFVDDTEGANVLADLLRKLDL